MRWDSSRPVPWRRLVKEAGLYLLLVGVTLLILFKDRSPVSIIPGLVLGSIAYLGVGYVMAKLGIQRKSAAEVRAQRQREREDGPRSADQPRSKPAPTRRTNASSTRPTSRRRRKR